MVRRAPHALAATLALGVWATSPPAWADGDESEIPRRRAVEILAHSDEQRHPSWLQVVGDSISIQRKHGLAWKHRFQVGDRPMRFRIHGPVVSNKTIGLGFKIKF